MDESEIRWNDEARAKILEDADRVLREAVLDLAETRSGDSADDLFAEINSRMKGRFIDYEPGPDVRKYAEAIADGRLTGEGGDAQGAGVEDPGVTDGPVGAGEDARGNETTSTSSSGGADLDSQGGNGVAADPGQGALAPDGDESDEVVNDG